MKLKKDEKLFFGCKIDSKLREGLSQAKPGDRKYFEDPDSEFLRVCTFENERWIGKVMKAGLGVGDVEDVQRNVVSILRRVAPGVRTSPASIKIFAVVEEQASDEPAPDPAASGGGGPYIEY